MKTCLFITSTKKTEVRNLQSATKIKKKMPIGIIDWEKIAFQ